MSRSLKDALKKVMLDFFKSDPKALEFRAQWLAENPVPKIWESTEEAWIDEMMPVPEWMAKSFMEHMNKIEEPAHSAEDDPLRPPETPVAVKCRHCDSVYMSNEMAWEKRGGMAWSLWWCKKPTCDGAGFGYDIFPHEQRG